MQTDVKSSPVDSQLPSLLARQRAAFLSVGAPSREKRRTQLLGLKNAILALRSEYQAAISADFGNRSRHETDVMEILPVTQGIDYLRKNLGRWMRPKHRHVAMQYRPATAKVLMQPLGVVGIVSPWNYPLALCLTPLATALAAGNRVIIKPSELTPRTTALMALMLSKLFAEDEVAVVTGGPDIGAAFSALPFDHLFFTGSTGVGKVIMHAAADNLVPVTLELGGKSPAIIDRDYSITRAAKALVYGKLSNAGQTCVAPDYAFVHEDRLNAFIDAFQTEARRAYPNGLADDGYAAIINQRHHDRLVDLIEDARKKGARIVQIGTTSTTGRPHTLPPTIISGATADMKVMQQEIFGPILPIVRYRKLEETIAQINANDRPLALYVFSDHQDVIDRVLSSTTSGSAVVNDTLLQFVQDDMPFGGVGPSGMGAYHGEEGFKTFSHAKSVLTQSRLSMVGIMRAPFGRLAERVLGFMLP
ncbi:MAG: coniferyl aldehyde dehydrogenase [Dokdonella sp.]|uniref:coniferyl aldehyde dehydrogenase n=1 Tax=Dokdonella sp. TaxID=2291710 RepID=UPI003265A70B